ncbi:MAG: type II toxin-antitoxin system ParD family antitoxin [Amaricoccus sp.]
MTPKLSRAVAAVAKLPEARQDALAALLLEAAARAADDPRERIDALDAALAEGEASGPAERFDFDAFLAEKRAALR